MQAAFARDRMRSADQDFSYRADMMFVAGIVFFVLFVVTTFAMIAFVVVVVLQAVFAKGERILDRRFRKLQAEQYKNLVVLPLCAAVVGGLISTAIPIFVAYPPWTRDSRVNVGYILLTIALFFGVAAPLGIRALYADPKNLLIGERIDRLKDGDWKHDRKADVIKTIDKDRAAVTKKLNSKGYWFFVLLALVIASDVGWIFLDHAVDGVWPGGTEILVMAAVILCGLVAWFWVRPVAFRSTLADLDSYRAEADELSPPGFTTLPPRASAVVHHYDYHDLWMAVGGLLAGAILARLGAVRSRGGRQG